MRQDLCQLLYEWAMEKYNITKPIPQTLEDYMNQKIMIFFCVFTLLFLTACNQSDHESPKHGNSNPAAESQDGGEEESKNQNTGALPDESAPKDGTQTDDMDDNSELEYNVQPVRDENADWKDFTTITQMQITVTDKKNTELQNISYSYDLSYEPAAFTGKVLLEDVNFDGSDDILLDLGRYGNQGVKYYACYLWNPAAKQYEEIPEFQEIRNPVLSSADQEVLSSWRNSADSYGYAKYRWENGTLQMTARISVDYDIETMEAEMTEERLVNKQMVRTGADKETIQKEWQPDTAMWAGDIAGKILYEE